MVDPCCRARVLIAHLARPVARDVERWIESAQGSEPKRQRTTEQAAASSSERALCDQPRAALSDAMVVSRSKAVTEGRSVYLVGFADLLHDFGSQSGLVVQMLADGESIDPAAPSLVASLARKSTATLGKRLPSLSLFRR